MKNGTTARNYKTTGYDRRNFILQNRVWVPGREKSSLSAQRIATDPAFVRSRENSREFGACARSGKLLRQAIRPLLGNVFDTQMVPRLTQVMTRVKNFDRISARGNRTVATGLTNPLSFDPLKEFSFNKHSVLDTVLSKRFHVDTATGTITMEDLVPGRDLTFPPGASHFSLKGGWAKIDFVERNYDLQQTNIFNQAINSNSQDVLLRIATQPSISGTNFFLVRLEFFQEINGIQYSLKNGYHHALSIIEIISS